ncbi:MAG: beta-mannosidase, partial [Chitinophagaceae bacterium]|nr:beta-mannosidase [Chitinophagaceae bacterium]
MPASTASFFRLLLAGVLLLFTFFLKAQKPADPLATPAAKRLFAGLDRLSKTHTLFGHQDALAYGVGWKGISGNSDVKIVTGDYPAVYGWDLGHLELDSARNLDGIPFTKMREYIREGYDREAVITISWHLRN